MNNPSMGNLLNNPDMLTTAVNMMKDPNNKAMLDMMQQQNPNINMNMMIKAVDVLAKLVSAYKGVKKAWSNVFVRLVVFAIIIAIIGYYFG